MNVGLLIAKLHAYIFFVILRPFKALNDRRGEFKANVILSMGMLFGALTITNLASIGFGHRLLLAKYEEESVTAFWVAICFGIGILNTYMLVIGNRWSRFEQDFQRYPAWVKSGSSIVVWWSLVVILVAIGWTGSLVGKL